MSHSKRLTFSVLTLSGIITALLLYTLNWVRSAELSALSPLLTVGGNLHPLLLHLPIGVFFYIGLSEVWNSIDQAFFKRWRIPGGLPMLTFGTITAVLSAFAGFLLYLQGEYSGGLIDRHMNWGTGFAIGSLITLWSALFFSEKSQTYRCILFINIIALSIAAHQGGLITHGDPLQPLFATEDPVEDDLPFELLLSYNVVDKILQSKCYDCHSVVKKKKGGLLMDSYEALLTGGKNGNALVPGNLEKSKISTYVHLPLDDDLHMPPEGKPQLTELEILFLDQWILAGASPDTPLIEQGLPEELVEWSILYMRSETAASQAPAQVVEDTEAPKLDFDALIAGIEQYALNSVTRLGPVGRHLVFSAVNARGTLTDDVLDALLPAAPYLIELDLANTALSMSAVGQLIRPATQLKRLNLSGMQVEPAALQPLVGIETLESLNLFNTARTADLLPLLREMTQLRTLYLGGTGLSPDDVTQLKMSLPRCEVVSDYYLIRHGAQLPED